jgi:hypothetical protein
MNKEKLNGKTLSILFIIVLVSAGAYASVKTDSFIIDSNNLWNSSGIYADAMHLADSLTAEYFRIDANNIWNDTALYITDIVISSSFSLFGNLNMHDNDISNMSSLSVNGNISSDYINAKNQVVKFHRNISINTVNTDWNNISWNIMVDDETTSGYSLENGNETIRIGFDGIIGFNGCVHPKNNAGGSEEQKLSIRILHNGVEARCSQASRTKTRQAGDIDTLTFPGGTIAVAENDTLNIQYKVSDIDLDIEPDADFDRPVTASINLKKLSN